MSQQRRGGTIELKVNGEIQDAKGSFSYNLGLPKKDAIVGSDAVHGYSEKPQVPFIEGAITDRSTLDLASLASGSGDVVTLTLANGKLIILREAWFAGEGTGTTEEGEITVRWEGKSCEEVLQ